METIPAAEGRKHFAELVDRALRGETIVITRSGRPVAQIGPVKEDKSGE